MPAGLFGFERFTISSLQLCRRSLTPAWSRLERPRGRRAVSHPTHICAVPHVILHVGPTRLPRFDPDRTAKIVCLQRADLADGAFVQALDDFPMPERITHGQAGNDREVLLSRLLAGGQDLADARRVHGNWFLREHMFAS